MHPPNIDQHVTFLYTADLAATAAFYEDILGLSLALDQTTCRIYRVCAHSFIGFCHSGAITPTAGTRQAGVMVTLVSQDVDGWHAYLQAAGVEIEKPPTLNEAYNIYQLFIRDPNGYLIEIQTFLDPAWPSPSA